MLTLDALIFMAAFSILFGLVGVVYWRAEYRRWSVWAFIFPLLLSFGILLIGYAILMLLSGP